MRSLRQEGRAGRGKKEGEKIAANFLWGLQLLFLMPFLPGMEPQPRLLQ